MTNGNDPAFASELMFSPDAVKEAENRGADMGGPFRLAGLTKRELFSAMALIARSLVPNSRLITDYAREAVQMADALIAELNKAEPK